MFVGDGLTTRDVLTGQRGRQPAPFTDEPDQAIASLRRIVPTGVKWVLPGHGAPWSGVRRSRITALLRLRFRQSSVVIEVKYYEQVHFHFQRPFPRSEKTLSMSAGCLSLQPSDRCNRCRLGCGQPSPSLGTKKSAFSPCLFTPPSDTLSSN